MGRVTQTACLVLILAAPGAAARAQPSGYPPSAASPPYGFPPEAQRTAEYYARNPAVRAQVLQQCRNDPGHLRRNPDCINAHQGEVIEAEGAARRRADITTPPSDPAYWARNPAERAQELAYCSRMTPQQQAHFDCDAARRSLGMPPR